MNDEERSILEDWVGRLTEALGLDRSAVELDDVLDLAGTAARSVVRPAAPLTTFLVGVAAGRAVAGGADPGRAFREAASKAESLAESE